MCGLSGKSRNRAVIVVSRRLLAAGTDNSLDIEKAQPAFWPDVASLPVASHLSPPSSTVKPPRLIMRVGRKSKGIDTLKAQSLTEVRKPNHLHCAAPVARPNRFLIVFRRAGCKTHPGFDPDLGPYFTRHHYRRTSSLGALWPHHQPRRLAKHPSPDMPRLRVLLRRG